MSDVEGAQKCGQTPPSPGATRCQRLDCGLIQWTQSSTEGRSEKVNMFNIAPLVERLRKWAKHQPYGDCPELIDAAIEASDVLEMQDELIERPIVPSSKERCKTMMTCPDCGWRAAVPDGWLTPSATSPASSTRVDDRPGRIPALEATRINASYWLNEARGKYAEGRGDALMCAEQAINAWKNAAYAAWDKMPYVYNDGFMAARKQYETPQSATERKDKEWGDDPDQSPCETMGQCHRYASACVEQGRVEYKDKFIAAVNELTGVLCFPDDIELFWERINRSSSTRS